VGALYTVHPVSFFDVITKNERKTDYISYRLCLFDYTYVLCSVRRFSVVAFYCLPLLFLFSVQFVNLVKFLPHDTAYTISYFELVNSLTFAFHSACSNLSY